MGIYNSINEAFERKYGLKDVKNTSTKKLNEAKESKKGTSIMSVLLKNKKDIWGAMADKWQTARDKVVELLDSPELKGNNKVAEAKEVFKNVRNESKFASLLTTYMTGMSITKNEDINVSKGGKKELKENITFKDFPNYDIEGMKAPFDNENQGFEVWTKDYGEGAVKYHGSVGVPDPKDQQEEMDRKGKFLVFIHFGRSYNHTTTSIAGRGFGIKATNKEVSSKKEIKNLLNELQNALQEFTNKHPEINSLRDIKKLDQELIDIYLNIQNGSSNNLNESYNRPRKLIEAKKKDLWDTIYGELTEDGSQYMVTDEKGRKTPRINKGAGYGYQDQITTDKDGNIVVRGKEERDFKAAIDIADKYAKEGVTYNIAKGDYGKGYTYGMTIEIPIKDKLGESFKSAIKKWVDNDEAAAIIYDWYDEEGAFDDFKNENDFINFAKDDIYNMIDKANIPHDIDIVKKALNMKSKLGEDLDSLGKDIEKYQNWVDYDMKRYHKISEITKKELDKAGLQVIKDQYGDYEVTAKDKEALGEARDLSNSPLKNMRDICNEIGINFPMFPDPVVGGYRLRKTGLRKEEAEDLLNRIKKAADKLGIKLFKAIAKPEPHTTFRDGEEAFMVFVTVPRYEAKLDESTSEEDLITIKRLKRYADENPNVKDTVLEIAEMIKKSNGEKVEVNESKKLRERYYYIDNNLSEKKAFWQSMRDAGATEKQLIDAQKGDLVTLDGAKYHILDKALPGTEFREGCSKKINEVLCRDYVRRIKKEFENNSKYDNNIWQVVIRGKYNGATGPCIIDLHVRDMNKFQSKPVLDFIRYLNLHPIISRKHSTVVGDYYRIELKEEF